MQFIAEVIAEGKSFLFVGKYSTAVLVLKALGVPHDMQPGTAIALHERSPSQVNSTGDKMIPVYDTICFEFTFLANNVYL